MLVDTLETKKEDKLQLLCCSLKGINDKRIVKFP